MNFNKRFTVALFALNFFSFSCTNEDVHGIAENAPLEAIEPSIEKDPKFEVVDGYLKFQIGADYLLAYELLSLKSKSELLAWSRGNGYTSLFDFYANKDSIFMSTFVPEERDYEPGESVIDKSDRLTSPALSTLYNKDGLLVVNDTIYKISGEYVYVIENKDFAQAASIENMSELKSSSNIPHYKHTIDLQHKEPPSSEGLELRDAFYSNLGSNFQRSYVYNINSTRREFVEFSNITSLVTPPGINPALYATQYYMKGQAQTKFLWWYPNFDDEIYRGCVNLNGNPRDEVGGLVTIYSALYFHIGVSGSCSVTFNVKKHVNSRADSYQNYYWW